MGDKDATYEDAIDDWLNEEKKYHGEVIGEGNMDDWEHFCERSFEYNSHYPFADCASCQRNVFGRLPRTWAWVKLRPRVDEPMLLEGIRLKAT